VGGDPDTTTCIVSCRARVPLTVNGTHTYPAARTYSTTSPHDALPICTATKTITRTSAVTVNEADVLTQDASQPTLAAQTEGTASGSIAIPKYDNTCTGAPAGDFSVSIDWGDGSAADTSATVSGSGAGP